MNFSAAACRPLEAKPPQQAPTAIQIRRYLTARRKRDEKNDKLFADPAWDILLDLFAADMEGGMVTVSSACIAGACPTTTGIRHLRLMEDAGLIVRSSHKRDMRMKLVAITEAGKDLVRTFLAHL